MKQIIHNPVLDKELKLRFRGSKSFLGLLFYIISIGILVLGIIYVQTLNSNYGFFRPEESQFMFIFLSIIQLILVLFITPGLTAGVISGEREKQTLNILLTTTQSSSSIIFGKLFSSVAYLLLLIISTLPLYSFTFLFGGVSPAQLISIFILYIITIFGVGSIGIFFSTILRRTIVSIIASYSFMLFLAMGTAFLFGITTAIGVNLAPGATSHPIPFLFSSINPFFAMISIIEPGMLDDFNNLFGLPIPIWLVYSIFYIFIFFLFTTLSIKRLRVKMKR